MRVPVDLPLDVLVPPAELFRHPSTIHGQAHVARVMVHAFRLIEATGWVEEAPRLWAAVYLHDLARRHDGFCVRHGRDAIEEFAGDEALRQLFASGGVRNHDYAAIQTAVIHHCLDDRLDRDHEHWRLTSLLKDADGLDRVRLGDLDVAYLRNHHAGEMAEFAEALYERTDGIIPVGRDHFAALWREAASICEEMQLQ